MFKCGTHDFSTNSIEKWDKHCSSKEHDYDLHVPCANKCGEKLHIKPHQKVTLDSTRIPRGYLCSNCKKNVQNVPEIKEESEV